MSPTSQKLNVDVLDLISLSYAERVSAAALQGLVNRGGPRFFVDYGIYDDPLARRTNEVFMADDIWFGKYRLLLGPQDQRNLDYYRKEHGVVAHTLKDLDEAVTKYRSSLRGIVVWDEAMPDSINIALMLAAQEDLLPIAPELLPRVKKLGLPLQHDLRGRWQDRVSLYEWAFKELFPRCKAGQVACIEPEWQRPEFLDYLVQQKIFIYNLSSQQKGLGATLLLLLAFGPAWLRELLFALRLDGCVRRLALSWLGNHSAEIKLNNKIQRSVQALPYPTIFGWHTKRDDELTFMLLLSANGLRLVPSHLASNFSFHSQVQPLAALAPAVKPPVPALDPQGTYITFTLSDGDQLMMMSTAELGSWYSERRGEVDFNWECQPLLSELAPALLEKFKRSATIRDCLVAGPSGAGYIVPPLTPNLPAYLRATLAICRKAGVNTVTSYVADPPRRVLRQLDRESQGEMNYLCGYAVISRAPQHLFGKTVIIANEIPEVAHIWDTAEQLLQSVKKLAEQPGSRPRFIGVHLFAYRTAYDDVADFARTLNDPHLHIVRADTFLELARLAHDPHSSRSSS